jgi:hypothetical protein
VTGDRRRCVVPDLGAELTGVLTSVQEMFVALGMAARFGRVVVPLPEPLAGGVALGAAVRVAWAVGPTQSSRARSLHPALPRLYGPDGRSEHPPLRFLEVDPVDLEVLGAAAALLGWALLPYADSGDLAMVLDDHARGCDTTATRLVTELARLHGLLDLEWTADVALLHARITAAGAADVILTGAEELAYQRTAERFAAMWDAGTVHSGEG